MAFQGMDREKMPFLFSTKLFFQFLIWSIGSECIWRKLTKDEICWLRGNVIYASLTTSTRTFLCVAAMEEVFWAAVAVFEIKFKKKNGDQIYSRLESSAFVIFKQHARMSTGVPICNFPQYQLASPQWYSHWTILGQC